MTTIKKQIESGRYPVDRKGRARVLCNGRWTATICATDGPPGEEIVGFGPNSVVAWNQDGVPSARTGDPHRDSLQRMPGSARMRAGASGKSKEKS